MLRKATEEARGHAGTLRNETSLEVIAVCNLGTSICQGCHTGLQTLMRTQTYNSARDINLLATLAAFLDAMVHDNQSLHNANHLCKYVVFSALTFLIEATQGEVADNKIFVASRTNVFSICLSTHRRAGAAYQQRGMAGVPTSSR